MDTVAAGGGAAVLMGRAVGRAVGGAVGRAVGRCAHVATVGGVGAVPSLRLSTAGQGGAGRSGSSRRRRSRERSRRDIASRCTHELVRIRAVCIQFTGRSGVVNTFVHR
jgi:hypothetical protein